MHQIGGNAVRVFGAYKDLLIVAKECSSTSSAFAQTAIPRFDETVLKQLCFDTLQYLRQRPAVVNIEAPVSIIGDVNGNLMDLVRIIAKCPSFSTNRFIFLGNYIGRGFFSVECLALLLSIYCLVPDNIVLLRGSNEFEEMSAALEFDKEINETYGSFDLHTSFQEVFSMLPLAAVVSKQIICVHGGITENISSVDQIRSIERPIFTSNEKIVEDLLSVNLSAPTGVYIGSQTEHSDVLRTFLKSNGLRKMIRGHECIDSGVTASCGGKLVTVFSNSNYNQQKNKAGFLFCNEALEVRGHSLNIARCPNRATANFQNVGIIGREQVKKAAPRAFRGTATKDSGSVLGRGPGMGQVKITIPKRNINHLLVKSNPSIKQSSFTNNDEVDSPQGSKSVITLADL